MGGASGLTLRLARRIALAGRLRTISAVAVTAVMVGLVVAGSILLTSLADTRGNRVESATGGAAIAIGIPGTPAAIRQAIAQVPSSSSADVLVLTPSMPIRSTAGVAVVPMVEQAWQLDHGRYRLLNGAYPQTRGTVVLTEPLARALAVGIGDQIQLGYDTAHSQRVVGLAENGASLSYQQILAGPGTRWSIHPPASVAPFISDSATLRIRSVEPTPKLLAQLAKLGQVQLESTVVEARPLFVRQPLLVGVPILLLVGGAVATVLLARVRRLRRDFGVLLAVGVPSRLVERAIIISNVALVAAGCLVGYLLGWSGASALRTTMVRWADQDIELRGISPDVVATLILTVMAATALVTWWSVRRTRWDDENGIGARPAIELPVPRPGKRTIVRRVVQVASLVGVVVLMKIAPADTIGFAVLAAVATIFALTTIPDLFRLAQSAGNRQSPAPRFATRVINREFLRGAVVAAAVLISLLSPLTIAATNASLDGYNRTVIRWSPLPGQLTIKSATALPDSVTNEIGSAANAPVVTLYSTGQYMPNAHENGNLLIVNSPDDLTAISNYQPTAAERSALAAGSALVFDAPDGHGQAVTLTAESGKRGARLPAIYPTGSWRGLHGETSGAVMLKGTAEMAGLKVSVDGYRVLGGADRIEAVRQAAMRQGLLPTQIAVDPGPPVSSSKQLPLAAIGGLILAFLLSIGVVLLGMREWKPNLQQLSDLGTPRRSIMAAGAVLTMLPAAIGAVLGILGGMLTATVRIAVSQVPLITPWGEYLIVTGALVVVLGVVGAALDD